MRWFSQQLIAGLFGSKFIILDSDGSSDGFLTLTQIGVTPSAGSEEGPLRRTLTGCQLLMPAPLAVLSTHGKVRQ